MTGVPWRSVGLVLLASTSLQVGLAVAATSFDSAGAMAAVWIRSVVGAALLTIYIRPNPRSFTAAQLGPVAVYGLALAGMTMFAYLAISRAPLGVVSAILMLGPLAIAAWGNRSPFDLVLVGIAAAGALTLSLADDVSGPVDAAGLAYAFAAALAFAAYIIAGKKVSQQVQGLGGLALALIIAAAIQTPLGIAFARPGLTELSVLATLAVAGVMATLIPFSLEAIALRTLPMATFGLLLAFEPAVAAIAGWVIRNEALTVQQVLGIALVVVAAAGSLGPRGWTRKIGAYDSQVMADPKVQALSRVPLFSGLSARDLASLAAATRERQAEVGEVLTREGDEGDEFFIIGEGAVAITSEDRQLRRLGPGDYLGEIALVFGGTRTATATVAEPVKLFVLQKDDFLAMLREQPRIEDKILATVSERMRYR
ncbi:MAG TPA: cyclic nucleotide-binding domain-containing protein [Candidatus Limnocylindria bacterium]